MPACQEEQELGVLSVLPGYIVEYFVTAGQGRLESPLQRRAGAV